MSSKFKHIDEHLSLRPFPQTINGLIPKEDKWKEYRTDMISQSGIAIFMFGNKLKDENPEIAIGVLNEYKIAKKNNVALIPIGSTGWAAREIFNEVSQNISDYPYLEEHIDILSKSNDQKQLINTILKIIDSLQVF